MKRSVCALFIILLLRFHQFKKEEVKTVVNGKTFIDHLHYRDLMVVLRDMVGDEELAKSFVFEPERHWMARKDGPGNERIFAEYYQSDDFWEIRVSTTAIVFFAWLTRLLGSYQYSARGGCKTS